MTGLEAIPKISDLLKELIERVRDGKAAALVLQVQSLFQTLQKSYFEAEQKVTKAERENLELSRAMSQAEKSHEKRVADLEAQNKKLVEAASRIERKHLEEMANLQSQNQTPKPIDPDQFNMGGIG